MSTEYLNYIAGISRSNRLTRTKSKGNINTEKRIKHLGSIKNTCNRTIDFRTKRGDNKVNKKTILIAESDCRVNAILSMFVSAMGYDYEIVASGPLALEKAGMANRKGRKHYDLIILDTQLDHGAGLDVAEEIRNKDLSQRIMIISQIPKNELNTVLLKKIQVKEGDLFTKPFRLSDILYAIEK